MSNNNSSEKFNEILLEAIDAALSTLGENAKKSIYFHLTTKFFINKQDIPSKIQDFSDVLDKVFGVGARNLEVLIMAKLHAKIKCIYEWKGPYWLIPNLTFSEYVELLRLSFENKEKIGELEVWANAEERRQYV